MRKSWLRKKKKERAAIYGTYEIEQGVPRNPIDPVHEIARCKDYCSQHGYRVIFTQLSLEHKQETAQNESLEFRRLLQAIERDELDLVLFIDYAWVSRKPEQVERLLSSAQAHQTTLIDVNRQQVIFQSL